MTLRSTHGSRWSRPALAGALACCLLASVSCTAIDTQPVYDALIRRTEGGIAHIKAADFGSLGYGTGYAMAEDNVCILADQFLTYAAQRARFLGPQGGNLESDYFYQLFIERGDALEPLDASQAALFRGAAAGYNRYLRDAGVAHLSDPNCRAQAWVRELGEIDLRRVSRMNFFYPHLAAQIVAAAPPAAGAAAAQATDAKAQAASAAEQDRSIGAAVEELLAPMRGRGSNGIAIGRDGTRSGTGMLLANPHQPWSGTARFWAFHQTIPGVLDVIGANVMGRPQVGVGTTEHVAWTSTVQTGALFTLYRLALVPGSPTRYLFDGQPRDMLAQTVTVQVSDGHGGVTRQSHTFYSTHFGALLVGGPSFPWTASFAYAMRVPDVGWRSIEALLPQYRAQSVHDYKAVQDRYQFNPSNQIAADSSGNAYYANTAPLPNLDDAQRAACAVSGGLDGSRSACMWQRDADAAAAGIFGPGRLPSLIRSDFASNMNDSHWLANPLAPLTGYDSSLGPVNTARRFRTRSGLTQIMARIAGSDGKGAAKFSLEQLQELITDDLAYTGRMLRDDLVTLCRKHPSVTLADGARVNIAAACPVLAAWDLRAGVDSRGAHVFREFAAADPSARVYAVPFDSRDPVNTPRGLDTTNNPAALQALAAAVQRLGAAGIALDARLGDLQFVTRNGERIPIPGGPETSGVLNKIEAGFSAQGGGYPDVTGSSSSWIQATELGAHGPVSRGVMTYSQTTNPNSPHYADQTKAFSQGRWIDLPFRDEDVARATKETVHLVERIGP